MTVWPNAAILCLSLLGIARTAMAQHVPRADTAAVVAAAAIAWHRSAPSAARPGWMRPEPEIWKIPVGDSLAFALADTLGIPTRPVSDDVYCSDGAPSGKETGLVTRVSIRFVADTATVMLVHGCVPFDHAHVRSLSLQAEHVRIVRRAGIWTVVKRAGEVT